MTESASRLPAGASQPSRGHCKRRPVDPRSPRPSSLLVRFFVPALGMLVLAAGTGVAFAVTGRDSLHWLALHLALLGGVSQLVLGAGQFFVCAFLATDPPSRRVVGGQSLAWNLGTLLVAVGVPTRAGALVDAGGTLIVIALVLFAGALVGMERRSLQRARWAVRWYKASAASLGLGVLVGILLARGTTWSAGSLLGAHLALNLGGWLGTAIVGTLHTFFPSLTHTRLRRPALQGATFMLWVSGVAELALGAAFGARPLLAAGWGELLLAAGLLAVNLIGSLRAAGDPPGLPARLVALGQAFLPAGLLLALSITVGDSASAPFAGASRNALAALLVAGWIGLTVAGALLHLLAVLGRVRHFARAMPGPRPLRDRVLAACAGVGIAALAIGQIPGLGRIVAPAAALIVAVSALLASRIVTLAIRALRTPTAHSA